MAKYKVFIWSEFPPKTQTGISIINRIILDTFVENKISFIVKEEYAWNKGVFATIIHHFLNYFAVLAILLKHRINYLYFTLTLSRGGILKVIAILPLIKLISRKTKLIGHIHRGDFDEFANKNLLNKYLLKYYFAFLYRVVILSNRFKEPLKRFIPLSKIYVLPNTSPIEGKMFRTKKYEKEFICLANYIRSKGLLELVESFKDERMENLKLTIYGSIYDAKFYNELKRIKSSNVRIQNTLKREKLAQTLCEYDCLIVPSWNEGQPMVILEAMSVGLPVIASKVGDIPDMLGNNYPFYTQVKSVSSLINKILLFDTYTEKEQLVDSLYQRYLKKYANKIFSENVLNLFK